MNEKINELKLLIKSDRRIWAIGGFLLIAIFITVMASGPSRPRRTVSIKANTGQVESAVDPNQGYRDLVLAMKNDVEAMTKIVSENRDITTRMQQNRARDQQRYTGIFDSVIDKIEQLAREVERVQESQQQAVNNASSDINFDNSTISALESDNLEGFGFDTATVPPPPAPPKPTKLTFISPGDSVPISLLAGVNAPVDGTPYPVMFKLDGLVTGPDGSALDVGDARLIGAAYGSETDERVLFRLTELAIRHKDGRRSVAKVDGWIVGEDGIRGMKGKVIDNLGAVIAATAAVSGVVAIGERIDEQGANIEVQNSDNITLNSGDLQVGAASALGDAANRLTSIILDRFEKQVPVVEVLSNRKAVAIFSSGAEIELFEDEYDDEGIYSASLLD